MRRGLLILFLIAFPVMVAAQAITKDLYFGMRGDPEVTRLQEFLRTQGYFIYPISTGNYFSVTLEAVKKFQKANRLSAVGGYFGTESRAVANRLLSQIKAKPLPSSAPAAVKTTPSPKPVSPPLAPNQSTYKGKIVISSLSGRSEKPLSESIILENRTEKESVVITGFKIQNSRGGEFLIPKAHALPGFSTQPLEYIILRPKDRAIITVGKQEHKADFRENLCTGYFDQTSQFSPSLSHQCPRPDTRKLLQFPDKCIKQIEAVPTCRIPVLTSAIESDCAKFLTEQFSYVACVRNYRDRADFYSSRWLVWMQQEQEFFRNVREQVTLKDAQGRIVDEQSY